MLRAFCVAVFPGHYRMLPDDWRHVSLSAQELVKDMLKLDATGAAFRVLHPHRVSTRRSSRPARSRDTHKSASCSTA